MKIEHVARTCKAGKSEMERVCGLCGRYFKQDERISILIPPMAYRTKYNKRLRNNLLAHENEVEKLVELCSDTDVFWNAVGKSKKPRIEKISDNEKELCSKFEIAVANMGYYKVSDTKTGIKCKKAGATDVLEYSVKSDRIRYSNQRKKYMFDTLVKCQIEANAYNAFHKVIGDNKFKDYSARKEAANILNTVVGSVNEMLGKRNDAQI